MRPSPVLGRDAAIVEKLADSADIDIGKSVRILELMIRDDREGWRIRGWVDAAKKILGQAMETTGEVREKAVGLIDYLGRRGYSEFGELLSKRSPEKE